MDSLSDQPAQPDPELAEAEALDAEVHNDPPPADELPEFEQPPQVETAQILGALLQPLFAIAAPGWGMQPNECQALADAWAPVVDKYFPDLQLGVELNAALVTLAVLGPRLRTPARPKPQPPADDQAEAEDEAA